MRKGVKTALLIHVQFLFCIKLLNLYGIGSMHIPSHLYFFSNKKQFDNNIPSLAPISTKIPSSLFF